MRRIIFITAFLFLINTIYAQKLTLDDYNRATGFIHENYNNKTIFNVHTEANWFKNNEGLWFVDYSNQGAEHKKVDLKDFIQQPLFDRERLASSLAKFSGKEIHANNLTLTNMEYLGDENLTFTNLGTTYALNLESYEIKVLREENDAEVNEFESKSPDGKWIAYSKDHNLFIRSTESEEEHQLSVDGSENYEYASNYGWFDLIEGEHGERPRHFWVSWSPDSKWLTTNIVDLRYAEKMYLLDWSIDSIYRPKLLSYYRGSPGDSTMVHLKPVFYNIGTKKEVKTELPKNTHINAVSIQWSGRPGVVYANYRTRGFKKEFVKEIDLNTTESRILIEEISGTNIDNFEYHLLEEKGKIAFLSERSGWRQLYLYDFKSNRVSHLGKGEYYVNDIKYIDKKSGDIYVLASGREVGSNPYHQQLYKVSLEGKMRLLTPEKLHHQVSFSKAGNYIVDNQSSVNTPTVTVLRSSKTGKVLTELTSADASHAIDKGWSAPETFQLVAKDGKTKIYGAIWKPSNFDSLKSYPIIDASYTGPHTQRFPKSFDVAFSNQALSELGFIVMQVDGLGTSGRSKEFQDHSYKNMGNNLEDHVLAIKYLGKKYDWIDTERVGIFGHSAGGYDTGRALTAFPNIYKVGVASSGDHDFRMEKAWWPEMYQGWPVDETYETFSNISNAKNLKGKLLLVHGGLDDNVNPSATFKFAEALVKADKEFDLLIIPSQRHGYVGQYKDYFTKKRWNYFVEHLLGEEPIWDFKLKP